jgi:hypothetical protein
MYIYPCNLPKVNKKKLSHFKSHTYTSSMLYSTEGLFMIKKNKLCQLHFKDDTQAIKKRIMDTDFIYDDSEIQYSNSHKIPYEFIRRDIIVTCYDMGSIKCYMEETDGILSHLYFRISDKNIFGIEEDINEFIQCAKS